MDWQARGGLVLVGLAWGACALCWNRHPEWFPAALRPEEIRTSPWNVDSLLVFLDSLPAGTSRPESRYTRSGAACRADARPVAILDLNAVDSAALEALPRVGAGLAGRIVRYREALGGFVSIAQLAEVWGIYPDQLDALLPRFEVHPGGQRQLCADTSSWHALRRHPYIGPEGARAIERYRKHHPLASVEELAASPAIGDSLLTKWRPYLTLCTP